MKKYERKESGKTGRVKNKVLGRTVLKSGYKIRKSTDR